jgi:hypothetical protein
LEDWQEVELEEQEYTVGELIDLMHINSHLVL